MCYKHFHTCKYCGSEYRCAQKNWICPTINGDVNANMCVPCHDRLEKALEELEAIDTSLTPEEILVKVDDNEN